MLSEMGITQWTVPWKDNELCRRAEEHGLSLLHLDLGSAEEGYPMTAPARRELWLDNASRHQIGIVSLALNDLCSHGFTAGLDDARSETAVRTMKYGVETAHAMGIPSVSVPHFFANRIDDNFSFRSAVQALRALCDRAAEYGILVYTENVLSHPELERLWNEVDRQNLRLLFDTQNYSAMSQTDAADVFLKWKDFCGDYIHLKDGDAPALGNKTLWNGTSGFERVFSAVLSSGYSGGMILESNYRNEDELMADTKRVGDRLSR